MSDCIATAISNILIYGFIVLIFVIIVLCCVSSNECEKQAYIVAVGGCNKDGLCGVGLSNGDFAKKEYPVVGEKYCVKYKSVKIWE